VVGGDQIGPIVVAVGNDSNGRAVEWAAAEASARGCPLHVVHAERLRWTVDPTGFVPVADFSSSPDAAGQILRTAVSRARAVAPDVDISSGALFGGTASVLLAQARVARLLVLGGGNASFPTGVRGRLIRPLFGAVTRRARCPVAIVKSLRSEASAPCLPRVVVGVDGAGECADAVGVAFRAAVQRGLPLAAVHAWAPDVPADHEAVSCPVATSERCARASLHRALEPWRRRFPDVPVETHLLAGDPAAVLIRESEGAALVVVGVRPHRAARAVLVGSVGSSVVQRARCPVVIVRRTKVNRGERASLGAVVDDAEGGMEPLRRREAPWE
jgi:nucleotide-binding universal stress UspA family protein